MKEYMVILSSIAFSVLICISDAFFESAVFHEKSFWDSLLFDVSGHAVYLRTVVAVCFLIFGFIVARVLSRQRKAELALSERSTHLAETNRRLEQEITERESADHSIRLEKERFLSLIEGAPFGMILVGDDGMFRYVNPEFTKLFGYGLADVPNGKQWFRKAYPDREYRRKVISDWLARREQADMGGQVHETYTVKCKGGTEKIVLFKPVRLPSQEYLVTCDDVTDRVKAEEETTRVETLLNSIVQHLPTPVFLKDTEELKYVLWNKACENLYGFSSDEVLGKTAHDFFPKEQADRLASQDRETLLTGQLMRIPEQPVDTRLKGTRITQTQKLPILDQTGRPAYLLAISEDITDRIQAEKELIQASKAAEQASRSKSEFLANMSHEIRTPINGIMGMTELALNTDLDPEQHEYLEAVRISADSLLKVINDVLDFSKIEAGKLELIHVRFRLRDVIGDTMTMLALQAHKKNLELVYHVPPDVPDSLIGDPGRLKQVLVNLVGNAIKFTDKGEVVARVERDSEANHQVRLHFSVTDTGIGIPPEKRDKIFRAFEQADGSTSRRYGGTGLGLAISSQFVELMGGKLWVESEVGKGSSFNFVASFAVCHEPLDIQPTEETSRLKGMGILVVDDNATNRRILEQMLSQWGMRPYLAENGPDALLAMEEAYHEGRAFHLVITDCMMPEMDGFELTERINRDQRLSTSTIIMLTSSGERGDASKCVKLGIAAYLLKPIKQSDLLFTLSRVLQESPARESRPSLITRHSIRESRKSLRILLAEDNVINQRLTVRLLERMGHTVSVAGNGLEALNAVQETGFDLVFMDVQMPHMDGLEATQSLRRQEENTGRHVPIIAMTAYAMKGDRERCLAAGMDGYVSKPISVQEVYEVIDRILGSAEPAAHGSADSPSTGQRLDKAQLMERVGGDADLLKEIVTIFLDDYPVLLTDIRNACEQRNPHSLEKSAHALKGAVGNFSAESAVRAALKLETMGRERNMEEAPRALAQLEREIGQLATQLGVLKEEI